jgi:hypothetical protein
MIFSRFLTSLACLAAATSMLLPALIANQDSLLKMDPSVRIAQQDTLQKLQVN